MRIAGFVAALSFAIFLSLSPHQTLAATPAVTITSPANGSTVRGSSLTVSVTVAYFRLVRPVFSRPPVLKGFAGSLQYILDSTANYVPQRDLTAATTHTWTNVPPGAHTVLVRFATSQHLPWPGGPVARVSVTVARVTPPAPHHHAGGGSPGVGSAPRTGGGAGLVSSPLNVSLILLAALLIILGLLFFGGRLTFATAPARREQTRPAPPLPDTAPQYLSVSPGPDENPNPAEETAMISDVFPAEATFPTSEPSDLEAESAALPAEHSAPEESPDQVHDLGATDPVPVPSPPATTERDRAIQLAREWSNVVEGLVRQIDDQEAERRRMLDHIRVLEDRLRGAQSVRDQLRLSAGDSISADDFQTLRYLTDALKRDPDHIVNLAAIAQHASKFHDLVEVYARLRATLSQP